MSSASEDGSTTGILSKSLSCSYVGDGGRQDETSGGEPSDGGDPDGDGGGVEALPSKEEDPLEPERECLVSLLSSIVNK
jgi:hypothetical protein